MPDRFPTAPRAPRSVRVGAIVIGALALAIGFRTTITSLAWVGRVFPGFVILDNRVIASVGLAQWSGSSIPGLYQSEVVAVDGRWVRSTPEAYRIVAEKAPGTLVRYRIRQEGTEREVEVATQRFTGRDWFLLYGVFLLNGVVFLISGLITWVLRPEAGLARALLATGCSVGVFLFTAMDLYGPATFFRLHVLAEAMLPGAALHLGLLFPQPHRFAHMRFAGYALALALAVPYEVFLYSPSEYTRVLRTSMLFLGMVAIFFCGRLVVAYWRSTSQLAIQRVRVIMLGTLFGFALPAVVLPLAAFMAGGVAMNTAAITPFVFALALAYAVVKHDLFEIDAMVKRGAYYLVLTGAITATYVAAVLGFDLVLRSGAVTDSLTFPVLFTLAVLLLFNPLRTRLQAFVDRVFFGTRYETAQVLATVGEALAGAVRRDQIARQVCTGVERAIPNSGTRLFAAGSDGVLRDVAADAVVPAALAERLATGHVITAFDPQEVYDDPRAQEAMRAALAALDTIIAVPLHFHGALVGVLTAGAKRSGLFYTAGDAEFLRALGHETAIALQNAASYDALVELNASLEERVRERTAQLEGANRELAHAYRELQQAEVQLVQSEKMASLGRLVAGVAHEINNPVSFIANSVAPLRRRLAKASELSSEDAARVLAEADDLVGIMGRGAERAAAIVRDLRSFSRLDEAVRKSVDLHEGLDVSIRLLEHRWRDRITIHRDYGALPLVECDPGQVNQIFVNVLANACDAIRGSGNLWIATRADDETVTVTIRDDGPGMPSEVRARIFDPFFTTKDVGSGTGLGLAISHGIVAAHGGRIEVESEEGAGATFVIVLPTHVLALDSKARRSG
jgi:signal transduction histidine kinase